MKNLTMSLIFAFLTLMIFSSSASAQQITSSFRYNVITDPMTDQTTESYSSTAGDLRLGFFCDSDGLNFMVSYEYMMIQSGASLTYRIGTQPSENVRFNLVSSDGESAFIWDNPQFFNDIVPALQSNESVLIQFTERVRGTHTISLTRASGIDQMSCASDFVIEITEEESDDTQQSDAVEPEPKQ